MNLDKKLLDRQFELIEKLNYYTKLYDEGKPEISDKEWDDMYFELQQLEKETRVISSTSPTQKIRYEVVNSLEKVKHDHPMLSLDKTKDWNEFVNYFGGKEATCMLKLDGLTCSLRYENGVLVKAETRGNGVIGENILHNAKVIQFIPKEIDYTDTLVIDGEVICTIPDFKEFADEYKNPRNFASGSVRLLDSKECHKRKLTFMVWNIIEGFEETNSFIEKLRLAEELGFEIVPYTPLKDDSMSYLRETAIITGCPIDGLVARFDDIEYGESLGATGHHAKAAYAYKFYDEEYETKLLDIEWTMGRTGVLTPIVVFEPIDTGESVIERASVHNLSVLYDLSGGGAYVGDTLSIYKANAIIPQVSGWEHNELDNSIGLIETCPVCGGEVCVETSDAGVKNLVCTNPLCEGKLINKLDYFAGKKGLDIKGLSVATLEKLIDWGWIESIYDIFTLSLHRSEWVKKPGFGVKSVDNILEAIQKAKNCSLDKYITALGIPLIGSRVSKEIVKYVKTYKEFRELIDNKFDFSKWDTFGYEKSNNLLKFDYSIADKIAEEYITFDAIAEQESNDLAGKTFCITGKLVHFKNRQELVNKIEAAGGKVTGSVTKNTNYLINNDISSTSAKNVAAERLGVPIITENEFLSFF